MKSIEERAKEYSKGQWDELTANKAYIEGQKSRKILMSRKRKTLLIKPVGGYLPILGIVKYLMNL